MQPGLHALKCSRCGAPLDPTERAKGEVVKCEHCGQPHLWIAPGRIEPQRAVSGGHAASGGGGMTAVVIGVAAIGVLAVATVGGFAWMRTGTSRTLPRDAVATADMPLAIGDDLQMRIDNHSCTVRVEGVSSDGRVVGVPCRSEQSVPIDRSRLTLEAFGEQPVSWRTLDAGDVVLAKTPTGWARRVVAGFEAGQRVRLQSLVPSTEMITAQKDVLRVQKSSLSGGFFGVRLPDTAPIEAGDVLWVREANTLVNVSVESVDGANVIVQTGFADSTGFKPDRKEPSTRPRNQLLVDAVRIRDPLSNGDVVLAQDGGNWVRRSVSADAGSYVVTRDAQGRGEKSFAKENMFSVRKRR